MTLRNVPNSFTLEQQRQELNEIAVDLDTAVDGVQTFSGDKTFSDNVTFQSNSYWGNLNKAIWNNDLEIYNTTDFFGSSNFISSSSDLIISTDQTDPKDIIIRNGGDDAIIANANGSVELYYDGAKKFETSLTGATVLGDLLVSALTGDVLDSNADTMIDVSEGNIYANTVYATGLGSNTTGQIITSYLVASSGMSYDATDPTNGIFLTPGSDVVAAEFTGNVTGDVTGDVLDSNANVMVDISEGAVYADKVWATGLGSNTTGEVVTSYLVATSGMSYDAADPTNGIFLTPGSDVVAAVFTGDVTGDVTGDLTGNSYGTHTGQTNGDVYTADGGTQVVDTANEPNPIFKGDAEGLTGSPNIEVGTLDASGLATFDGNIILPDGTGTGTSGRLSLGDGADLRLYHDGTTTTNWIQSNSLLNLQSLGVTVTSWTNLEKLADFNLNGSVDLYYDGAKKFETTNTGASVTGTLAASLLTGDLTGDVTANTVSSGSLEISGQTSSTATGVTVTSTSLDHYEEGTWTPIVMSGSDIITFTGGDQSYTYTKIGDTVHLYFSAIDSTTSGTTGGLLTIEGMPFVPFYDDSGAFPASNGYSAVGSVLWDNIGFEGSNWPAVCYVESNRSIIDIFTKTAGLSLAISSVMVNTVGSNSRLHFSITYKTNS